MRLAFLDRMTFENIKTFEDRGIEYNGLCLWQRLSNNLYTFIMLNEIRKGPIKNSLYNLMLLPWAPFMDLFFHVVLKVFMLLGFLGLTRLPDLRLSNTLSKREDFQDEPIQIKSEVPLARYSSGADCGECDGRYLWMKGVRIWSVIFAVGWTPVAGVLLFVTLAWGWPMTAFLIFTPLAWLFAWRPQRYGVLFNREAQTATFFRGSLKPPVVIPFDQVGYTWALTGSRNLTKDLVIFSRLQPKDQKRPLRIITSVGGSFSGTLAASAKAIDEFMDKDNLGAFCSSMQRSIKDFRKYRLTLWRLTWKNPPQEEWARYQAQSSLYQIPLPEEGSEAFRLAERADERQEVAKAKGLEDFVLGVLKKEKDLNSLNELPEAWQEDAEKALCESIKFAAQMCSTIRHDLKEEGKEPPPILMELFRESTALRDACNLNNCRNALAELQKIEHKKLTWLQSGKISQELFKQLEIFPIVLARQEQYGYLVFL